MDPRVKHFRLLRMHTVFFRSTTCLHMPLFHGPLALSARPAPRFSVLLKAVLLHPFLFHGPLALSARPAPRFSVWLFMGLLALSMRLAPHRTLCLDRHAAAVADLLPAGEQVDRTAVWRCIVLGISPFERV